MTYHTEWILWHWLYQSCCVDIQFGWLSKCTVVGLNICCETYTSYMLLWAWPAAQSQDSQILFAFSIVKSSQVRRQSKSCSIMLGLKFYADSTHHLQCTPDIESRYFVVVCRDLCCCTGKDAKGAYSLGGEFEKLRLGCRWVANQKYIDISSPGSSIWKFLH